MILVIHSVLLVVVFTPFFPISLSHVYLSYPLSTMYCCMLKQARMDYSLRETHSFSRHIPQYPHQPDIGKNSRYPIERDRDNFFQRLYDHRMVTEEFRKALDHEINHEPMEKDKRMITPTQLKAFVDRYLLL